MAFISATGTPADPSGAATFTVDMPATVSSGDVLVMIAAHLDGASALTATGWTQAAYYNGGNHAASVLTRTSDGTEGGTTVDLSVNSAVGGSAIVWRFGSASGNVEVSANSNGSGSAPDPVSLTPSWGSKATEWLALWTAADDDIVTSSGPTDYSNNTSQATGLGTNASATCGGATRSLTATAEDPGAFTLTSSETWYVWTVAVEPSGAADETAPTLSSASATATGATTGSGSVSTDEGNGTLYWVVTQSATSPSVAQVQAGQDHAGSAADDSGNQSVSGTGSQNVSGGFTGLTAETTYYAHYQHQDAATNDSTVASSSSFTTSAVDNTAPTYGSNPAQDSVDHNSVTCVATASDETDATVDHYAVVVANEATAPSGAQIKAGNDSTGSAAIASGSDTGVSNASEASITLGGLSAETAYDVYWTCEDSSGNLATPQKVDITTSAAPASSALLLLDSEMTNRYAVIEKGATDQSVDVFIQDSSDGTALTGLAFNTSSLVCYYRRGGTGSITQLTLATQTVTGAHDDGGFVEISSTNAPGWYRLDLSDAIVATGVDRATVVLSGAANMQPCGIELDLVDAPADIDVGLTASAISSVQSGLATSAALATVDGNVDSILEDTGTTLPASLAALNDLSAAEVNAEVDTALADYDPPTRAELTSDIGTVTTAIGNLNDITVSDVLTTAMTESYASDGSAPTLAQAVFAIQQFLFDKDVSGTTLTVRQLDGTTSAMTFTLDDGSNPTDINRTG